MIKMVVLLCALGTTPAECVPGKAERSIDGPQYSLGSICELHRAWFKADAEVKRHALRLRPNSYFKLVCVQILVS